MTVGVKICGLSNAASIECAIAAGAEYIGLNFYPPSPRYVVPTAAAALADQARGRTKIVAVVVDADDDLLKKIVDAVDPDMFQAHGSETPERIAEIGALTGKPVIRAIKVREQSDIASAGDYVGEASMFLFDAKAPETLQDALPGGNGIVFDWSLLGGKEDDMCYMLSGGLDAENVADAIRITGAPIVDVSSGVEQAPGKKNLDLIRKFVVAAKSAG